MLQTKRLPPKLTPNLRRLSAVLLLGTTLWSCQKENPRPAPPPPPPPHAGLLAQAPDTELLQAARNQMGGRTEVCGPYLLITDVQNPRLLKACGHLASRLDAVYTKRYGIEPVGEARGAILLFSTMKPYGDFAKERGLSAGYAGFSIGSRGVVLLHAEVRPLQNLLNTLTHELSHLVNRRALGGDLPPWLSEGLASEIGFSAEEHGFRELPHQAGGGIRAERLREAYKSGRAGNLQRLLGLTYREFDRAAVSFDYEQSTLLVRYLLADGSRATKFRAFLGALQQDVPGDSSSLLLQFLDVSPERLEEGFEKWLVATAAG